MQGRTRHAAVPGGYPVKPTNLPASVHGRLTDRARQTGRPFQELLEYFGMERFLYRLSRTQHAELFVLELQAPHAQGLPGRG